MTDIASGASAPRKSRLPIYLQPRFALAVVAFSVLLLAGLTAGGVFANDTSTAGPAAADTTGIADINVGVTGTTANQLSITTTNLLPGGGQDRAVALVNSGTLNLSEVQISSSGSGNVLDTDTSNGLQLQVRECSTPWTETGSGPDAYTCSGVLTNLIPTQPIIGSWVFMSGLNSLTVGAVDYLDVTVSLPATATQSMVSQTETTTFSFAGIQRSPLP